MNLQEVIADALRTQVTSLSDERITELVQKIVQHLEGEAALKSVPAGLLAQGVQQASPSIQLMLASEKSSIQDAAQYALKFVINHITDDPSSTIPENHWAEENCPYPGLPAFSEENAAFFYGREDDIERFLRQTERPILALTGASGVGKSSFIWAGVLPRLREQFRERAVFLNFRIHADAGWLRDFAEALGQQIGQPAAHILAAVREREDALVTILKEAFAQGKRVFLVLDQFEALFVGDDEHKTVDRRCFLDNLLNTETSQTPFSLTTIIVTRENFFEHPDYNARHRLAELIQQENISLWALSEHQLRQAIEQPLRQYNQQHGLALRFQPGVVDLLIRDFRNPRVSLPLVQHLLRLLWTEKHHLTHLAYNSLGGLERVLDRHALEIYQGFADVDPKLVRAVLLALVRPGIAGEYTRKRVDKQRLFINGTAQELQTIAHIIDRLSATDSRIISEQQIGNTTYVEFTHEVLLRQWTLLQQLIEERKEQIEERERLLPKAEAWWTSRRTQGPSGDKGELYTGNELKRAKRYLEFVAPREKVDGTIAACYQASRRYHNQRLIRNTTLVAAAFLLFAIIVSSLRSQASEAEENRLTAEARQGAAEATTTAEFIARATIQIERNEEATRRTQAQATSVAEAAARATAEVVANVAATTEADAVAQLSETERRNLIIRAEELAAESAIALERSPSLALLLAVEAIYATTQSGERPQAVADENIRMILEGIGGVPIVASSEDPEDPFVSRAFSADWRWFATENQSGKVQLWNVTDDNATPFTLNNGEIPITALALSPDGHWLAIGSHEDRPIVRSLAEIENATDAFIQLWNIDNLEGEPLILPTNVGDIETLLFTNDGRFLVNSDAQLWDLEDLDAEPRQLPSPQHNASVVTISPDGRWLAAGGIDQVAQLWDITSPTSEPFPLGPHDAEGVLALKFSPDGQWLATATGNAFIPRGLVQLWNLTDPTAEQIQLEMQNTVFSVAFSADGRWLAAGSRDGTAQVWDLTNLGTEPLFLSGHQDSVSSVSFSPDGVWLATASWDNTVRLWRTNDPANPMVLIGHEDSVGSVVFSPDGRWLITTSGDGTVRKWDINDPMGASGILYNSGRLGDAVFSPTGHWLATGSTEAPVRLWNVTDSTEAPVVLPGAINLGGQLAFSPDGQWLATGSSEGTVWAWNVTDYQQEPLGLIGHTDSVGRLQFSPDSQWLATGSTEVRLWNFGEPGALPTEPSFVLEGHEPGVLELAFSPDGQKLATVSFNRTLRVYDMAHLSMEPAMQHIGEETHGIITFSPDGRWLAIGGNGNVLLWDMTDLESVLVPLKGHASAVNTLVFSPDGNWLVSAGIIALEGTLNLWDMSNLEREPLKLPNYEMGVWDAAFSPDGRWLITGNENTRIWLWDMMDLDRGPITLHGYESAVLATIVSPDGEWLATLSRDEPPRLWPLSLDNLLSLACTYAGRNLTWNEWERFFPDEPYRSTCSHWPVHPTAP